MNKQVIFDKVVTHLLTQNSRGGNGEPNSCRYRGINGSSCAVGCLIPDELYNADLEGGSVTGTLSSSIKVRDALFKAGILSSPNSDYDGQTLLQELQQCHDTVPVDQWHSALQWIADGHHLTMPSI